MWVYDIPIHDMSHYLKLLALVPLVLAVPQVRLAQIITAMMYVLT